MPEAGAGEAGGGDDAGGDDSGVRDAGDADAPGSVAPPGFALQFADGAQPQYVIIPDEAALNLTSAFTMEAWVSVAANAGSGAAAILTQPYGAGGAKTSGAWIGGGSVYASVTVADADTASAPAPWSGGGWHHVAWTYDGACDGGTGCVTLYVDGSEVAAQTGAPGLPTYDGHSLVIGADIAAGAFADGFAGVIDEVRIFATARCQAQIADDMALASPSGDPTLVAYYPFDEGFGLVAHDASPNHFDAILGDAADPTATAPSWVRSTVPVGTPGEGNGCAIEDAGIRVALELDPTRQDEYVVLPNSGAVNPPESYTYEVWVALNGATTGPAYVLSKRCVGCAFSCGGQCELDRTVAIWFAGGTLFAGADLPEFSMSTISIPWTYPRGDWHHLAFTFDQVSGYATLYIDGAVAGTPLTSAGPVYSANPLILGADVEDGGTLAGFQGLLADFRIFAEARDAGAIALDMAGGPPTGDPALSAWYPLDDGAGVSAADRAASSANASGAASTGLPGVLGASGVGAPVWVVARTPF